MTRLVRNLAVVLACALVACSPCIETVSAEIDSPDRASTATWWVVNCGATTDYMTQVSVHPKSVSYRKVDNAVLGTYGNPKLSISWVDSKTLSIKCSDCDPKKIQGQFTKMGDITIMFDFGPASGK